MKSVKEQIRRIRVIRDRFWTWRASQRRVSSSSRYCLPDSYFCVVVKTPRLRPGLLSLRSVLPSRQRLSVRSVESVIEWKALRSCVFFFEHGSDGLNGCRKTPNLHYGGLYIFIVFVYWCFIVFKTIQKLRKSLICNVKKLRKFCFILILLFVIHYLSVSLQTKMVI